ncbi:hypothetical protein SAMN04487917_101399 [Arthrobacter sp. yr096]|nr:hypothetical protein SAMN04487917_101399 [Arthrobacter sp. yr096]
MGSDRLAAVTSYTSATATCAAWGEPPKDAADGSKKETRPYALEAGARAGVAWMTLRDFGEMASSCSLTPSQMWAELEREHQLGPSMTLV